MTTPDNSSEADRKVQRITPEGPLTFPGWFYNRHTGNGPWHRITEAPAAVVCLISIGYTHHHPDQPDAPQEVPDASPNEFAMSRLSERGEDITNEPPPYVGDSPSPAPSKETIANSLTADISRVIWGLGTRGDEYLSATKAVRELLIRALDRAGEAKGADEATSNNAQFRQALKQANAITVAEHAKSQAASGDAGTRKEETPARAAAEEIVGITRKAFESMIEKDGGIPRDRWECALREDVAHYAAIITKHFAALTANPRLLSEGPAQSP